MWNHENYPKIELFKFHVDYLLFTRDHILHISDSFIFVKKFKTIFP